MIKLFSFDEIDALESITNSGCKRCPYFYEPDCPIGEDEELICDGGYFREVIDEPEPTPNPKPNQHEKEIDLLDKFAIAVLPSINLQYADAIAEAAYEVAVEMLKRRKEVIKTLDE